LLDINIRKARNNKGYTQAYVARLIGVSRTAYNKYENGVSNPDNQTLAMLAKIFNCSTDYLLGVTLPDESNSEIINIGEQLKKAREDNNYSPSFVAANTGISFQQLTEYENDIQMPDLSTLKKLLILYNISADTVLNLPSSCNNFTHEEIEFIDMYRKLPESMKIEIKGEVKGIARVTNPVDSSEKIRKKQT
jgi:transcriptional regulator with XRE-family HTH domain